MGDGQAVLGGICGNEGAVPDRLVKKELRKKSYPFHRFLSGHSLISEVTNVMAWFCSHMNWQQFKTMSSGVRLC